MLRLTILALAAVTCLQGCGFNSALTRENLGYTQRFDAGFRYVKTDVTARMTDSHLLCILPAPWQSPPAVGIPIGGGANWTSLVRELHRQAGLRPNQTLTNLRADTDFRWFLLWCNSTMTLAADVIEFGPATAGAGAAPSAWTDPEKEEAAAAAASGARAADAASPSRRRYTTAECRTAPRCAGQDCGSIRGRCWIRDAEGKRTWTDDGTPASE
jgi:hypothetical protein